VPFLLLVMLIASRGLTLVSTMRRAARSIPSSSSLFSSTSREEEPTTTMGRVKNAKAGEAGEWNNWNFGTFHSQLLPTKQQREYIAELEAKSPPVVDPLWNNLTDEEASLGVATLRKYITSERLAKFERVLSERTSFVRFAFENPANSNNVWAALRTFDSFGVQYVDVVSSPALYHNKWRRDTMSQALGAQKWLSLRQHWEIESCIGDLKNKGYRVGVSDLHSSSLRVHDVDWKKQKTVIVLGNEERGVSEECKALADFSFHLPMRGFAESLNVSAFCAALCGTLDEQGVLQNKDIGQGERDRIMLTWLARTAPGSLPLLRRAGLEIKSDKLYETIEGFSSKP